MGVDMKWINGILVTLIAVGAASAPATTRPVIDCPLRNKPFSVASPLVDIFLNPAAKAIVDLEMPRGFSQLPVDVTRTQSPTFASILTLGDSSLMLGIPPDALARIDAALRRLRVTRADRIARCERYDNDTPEISLPAGQPRILLFDKSTGFRDNPSVAAANAAFTAMAQRKHWALVSTDRGGAFTASFLRQFDAVIWNNVSGDVLTLSQRRALRRWIERGGAFIGVHGSAGDPVYFWDWYADTLIGARFAGHPMTKHLQNARIVVEARDHAIAQGLPGEWVMQDEWYSFKNSPRASGSRIIATLDESTYDPETWGQQSLRMGDHPIAWARCVGKGRMFYSAIGHRPESYVNPQHVTMFESAIGWAVSIDHTECRI